MAGAWVLLVIVMGQATDSGAATTHIPGFTTLKLCADAQRQIVQERPHAWGIGHVETYCFRTRLDDAVAGAAASGSGDGNQR